MQTLGDSTCRMLNSCCGSLEFMSLRSVVVVYVCGCIAFVMVCWGECIAFVMVHWEECNAFVMVHWEECNVFVMVH